MSVRALTDALLEEADLIDELLGAVVEQRDMVKSGNHLALQDLMKRVQSISFRVQAQEAQRARLAQAAAEELRCEPKLSALAEALSGLPEAALFRGAGERLRYSVFALKAEMTILSGLIEQNERFSAMLLSEWRRLDAGFMRSGGLDFRG
ncbi:MAG: flagellar protein FlgN [Synergistaceae bacterium]|nr:flagellar protein FlgN [Synergistaceae bacterium]